MTTLHLPDTNVDSLDLTVRFSVSLPDLLISVSNKPKTTTATLKQTIRSHLPAEFSKRRVRLIHAGKALVDDVPLSIALKLSPSSSTPSRTSTPQPDKGKSVVRDPPSSRIYIHCSIGDVVLSPAELAAESFLAHSLTTSSAAAVEQPTTPSTSTTPAPRGFDRLLTTGFTPAEISQLRLQFLAIQAHTHTPDTLPSPNTLRDLEDRWLDNSSSVGTDETTDVQGIAYDDDGTDTQLEDIIWGSAMGFFWPVGCVCWALREEGIWSRRRKMAVVVGVLVNVGLGVVRWMG